MLIIRRIVGESMYPTYKEGQIVIGLKSKEYRIGQIVIAIQNNREVVKRITAIGDGYYNLVGDNLAKSSDSRKLGPVKKGDILGKVILTI